VATAVASTAQRRTPPCAPATRAILAADVSVDRRNNCLDLEASRPTWGRRTPHHAAIGSATPHHPRSRDEARDESGAPARHACVESRDRV